MLVQMVIKGLFLYIAFLVIRSLLRGFTQVKTMKDAMREAMENQQTPHQGQQRSQSSSSKGDTVEAEFRRL